MDKNLLSVGLDVGTSTTQMVVSRLQVRNRASAFGAPDLEIGEREILYRSPVYLTPLLGENRVDGEKILEIVKQEYKTAGITPETVDTGAVIITGETSRKENARAVTQSLSEYAGDFVVATAGPDLESILAAKGAGAVAYSESTGKQVLHMDIGGGTSNLALIENGRIVRTGCLNVGGRLVKLDKSRTVTYVSPVLQGLTDLQPGQQAAGEKLMQVARLLTEALEMAAGLRQRTALLEQLATREAGAVWACSPGAVLSFSGGVADCIAAPRAFGEFGDLGPELGTAIRESRLCQGEYVLGQETIRATVIGAGCHSTQLSGSTVYVRNVRLPLKNLPVIRLSEEEQLDSSAIREKMRTADGGPCVLALPGFPGADYARICQLSQVLNQLEAGPIYACVQQDMGKALGQRLSILRPGTEILCLDGLNIPPESFLDVGEPVGPAFPVVMKTLVLESRGVI